MLVFFTVIILRGIKARNLEKLRNKIKQISLINTSQPQNF